MAGKGRGKFGAGDGAPGAELIEDDGRNVEGEATGQPSACKAVAWRAKFGQAHARITTQILPKFPKAVIAKAQTEARPRLHLPIEVAG